MIKSLIEKQVKVIKDVYREIYDKMFYFIYNKKNVN